MTGLTSFSGSLISPCVEVELSRARLVGCIETGFTRTDINISSALQKGYSSSVVGRYSGFSPHRSAALSFVYPDELDFLESLYSFTDKNEVSRFLATNPVLIPLLLEVSAKVHQYFPFSALVIEPYSAPEAGIEMMVYVKIVSDLPVKEAMRNLRRFNYGWWYNASELVSDLISVDVELV